MLIPHGKKYSIANVVEGSFHYMFEKQVYLNCRETEGISWWAFHSFPPIVDSTDSPSDVKATKVLSATSEARRLPGSTNYTFISRSPSLPWGLITAWASFPHYRNCSLSRCTGKYRSKGNLSSRGRTSWDVAENGKSSHRRTKLEFRCHPDQSFYP